MNDFIICLLYAICVGLHLEDHPFISPADEARLKWTPAQWQREHDIQQALDDLERDFNIAVLIDTERFLQHAIARQRLRNQQYQGIRKQITVEHN